MLRISRDHRPRLSREKGFYIYDESESPLNWVPDVVNESREILRCAQREELNAKADGELYTGLSSAIELTEESAYIKFALQKNIINLASEYLGIVPVLAHI